MEVRDVDFERMHDEALWVGAWYAMVRGGKRNGDDVLHTVLLPYLTGESFDATMVASHDACQALGMPDAPMRSPRLTRADYGVARTATT